jgi:GTPase Era involved in 16S rRNA processing
VDTNGKNGKQVNCRVVVVVENARKKKMCVGERGESIE